MCTGWTAAPAAGYRRSSWAMRRPETSSKSSSEAKGWHYTGDRVTFDSTIFCGACPFCARGEVNLCDNRQVLGVSCGDYRRQGAFAEFVAVPARVLCRLPANLNYEHAAMVEPVAVSVHGVNRVQLSKADRVAVIGVGMIGLLVVQSLKGQEVFPI